MFSTHFRHLSPVLGPKPCPEAGPNREASSAGTHGPRKFPPVWGPAMTQLASGSICTIKQFGAQLWVWVGRTDGRRGRLRSMRVDQRGRADFTRRDAGVGDVVLIREAAIYSPGSMIDVDGIRHEVARDFGDEVELLAPQMSCPLRRGGNSSEGHWL